VAGSTDFGQFRSTVNGIALTALLIASAIHLPLVGLVSLPLIPLPALYYRLRLGRRPGALVAVGAAMASAAILGRISVDCFFFVALVVSGYVLGDRFELRSPLERAVLAASGSNLAVALAGMLVLSALAGGGLMEFLSDYISRNLALTLDFYRSAGLPEETVALIAGATERIAYVLVRILPGMMAAAALLLSWSTLLLARPLLLARRMALPEYGPLVRWRAPEALVWLLIGCGLLLLLPARDVKILGLNGLLVLMVIYFFQGIAIVAFFFERRRFPRPLRVLLYSLLALQQVLLLLVVALGLFDMWLNFRKLDHQSGGAAAPP
jgi:uncharacterized protein YybS (DUF2232 family)